MTFVPINRFCDLKNYARQQEGDSILINLHSYMIHRWQALSPCMRYSMEFDLSPLNERRPLLQILHQKAAFSMMWDFESYLPMATEMINSGVSRSLWPWRGECPPRRRSLFQWWKSLKIGYGTDERSPDTSWEPEMIVNQLAVVVGWILYIPIVSVWPHSFEIMSQRGGQPEGLTDDPRVSKPHVLGQCYREIAR